MHRPAVLPPCGAQVCDNLMCSTLETSVSVQCSSELQCVAIDTHNCDGGATPSPPISNICDAATQSIPGINSRDCATQSELITFSPALCQELISTLSSEQLSRELDYFGIRNNKFNCGRKRALIKHEFNDITHIELNHTTTNLNHCHELIQSFSCTLSSYEERILELTNNLQQAETLINQLNRKTTPTVSDFNTHFSRVDVDFGQITINECTENINFEKLGNRKVAYFGDVPYRYPGKEHIPCEYPETPIFERMFTEIKRFDDDFTKSNYTCLVTQYDHGGDFINFHGDDEDSIVPDSTIYCASFGATRDIIFVSKMDPQTEHSYSLPSGSVYSMSAQSQHSWRHSIPRDPSITDCRVSFTFRRMKSPYESELASKPIKPPFVANSDPYVKTALIPPVHRPRFEGDSSNNKKVLFLTDSILRSFPEKSFGHNVT